MIVIIIIHFTRQLCDTREKKILISFAIADVLLQLVQSFADDAMESFLFYSVRSMHINECRVPHYYYSYIVKLLKKKIDLKALTY